MKKYSILLVFLIVTVACMAPKQTPPVFSRELARIDDIIVKEDVLRFRMRLEMDKYPQGYFKQESNDITEKSKMQEMARFILGKIINDYVIIAYAKKQKIQISEDIIEQKIEDRKKQWNPKSFESFLNEKNIPYSRWRQLLEDEIRVQQIMEKEFSGQLEVSSKEIVDYYQNNKNEFSVPERVRVRQIVTDSKDKAKELHKRLVAGENFAKIAVDHSQSPDRARGGDLGYFAKGTYPKEFDDTCFKMQKGEISDVVKSDYGYHIFKLVNIKPAGHKTLEEVTAQIYQKIFEEKLKKKYDPWIEKIRSKVSVHIEKQVLQNFIL